MFVSTIPHTTKTEARLKNDTSRTLFNSALALILIFLSLPLFLTISLMILIRSGRPIIYRGVRLGLGKKRFTMYKFRTLSVGAEKVIGAKLFSESQMTCLSQDLVTPVGKFLRDTRLDELPQLINVLKGDMVFVGPRPERQVVYESTCRHISRYEERFQVKPGLIGYAQLFTPHCTPKRMRSLIDNRFLKIRPNLGTDVFIIIYTTILVISTTIRKMIQLGLSLIRRPKNDDCEIFCSQQFESRRIRHGNGNVFLKSGFGKRVTILKAGLCAINDEDFYFRIDNAVRNIKNIYEFKLTIPISKRMIKKSKVARCKGEIYPIAQKNGQYYYRVKYKPLSPLDDYLIQQYFLGKSIAPFYQVHGLWNWIISHDIWAGRRFAPRTSTPGISTVKIPKSQTE